MEPRRKPLSRRMRLLRTAVAPALLVSVALGIDATRSSSRTKHPPRRTSPTTTGRPLPGPDGTTAALAPAAPPRYREAALLALGHAVADPAAGALGGQVLFAGGLDATSTSTARIGSIIGRTVRTLPSLPTAFHDAAGAVVADRLLVFGGGDGVNQLDTILSVDSAGHTTVVGRLPSRSSDSIAATIGRTAYVVGGFDGSQWLDTIVAFSPDRGARVVAHLPVGLRYPAVGAAGGRLVIAGGTTPTSHATGAIYSFDPTTAVVSMIGALAQPITHASAVGSGREVLITGGQSSARQSEAEIVAVDPVARRVRDAGALAAGRSDAALVSEAGRLLLIGGKRAGATLSSVSELVPVADRTNVYAHDGANALNPEAAAARSLVYVPNSMSNTVDVIDPATYTVIDHFRVGALPQHVTPSWDFKTLYVDNDHGNSLTPIDPRTGRRRGPDIAVADPYNLYFTTNGRFAIVVAEARDRLDFRDAHTMKLVKSVPIPCRGIDHMDYTADGSLALASCEFSGQLVVVDLVQPSVRTTIALPSRGAAPRPQDVKLGPDGTVFYVADMNAGGVWEVDARTFTIEGFVSTGSGAHGLYPSRDARYLYVMNRGAGTISVVDFSTRAVVQTWTIPGGSPDMGGVSADGKVLWVSGRFASSVYAISTTDGHVIATIPVGNQPHGLCVWPQPGRYSIGHTGITR